jgi:ribosomal protein S18 acetylase RimI-like enzyme
VSTWRIEPVLRTDVPSIGILLREVAENAGGLVRIPEQLTDDYVASVVKHSLNGGIALVARSTDRSCILGVILAQALIPRALSHVLGELTMAVHPDNQRLGIGRALLQELIAMVTSRHPHILRVELLTRESNDRARALYRACGFREEGRLEGRIRGANGQFESDIPMAWMRPS